MQRCGGHAGWMQATEGRGVKKLQAIFAVPIGSLRKTAFIVFKFENGA